MRNSIFSLLFIGCLLTAKAQLPNASFELTDSLGNTDGWNLAQGKISRFSVINFGVLPFTAAHGNYFILLESDTATLPVKRALFEQTAAFNDTPGSVYLNYLYIPENTAQHAEITLFFSKWNGTQRDTILYKNDTIPVVANGNTIPIQWNVYSANLKSSYRVAMLPDTAWIRISNTDNIVPGKNIKLFADNITFGKWAVGLKEQAANVVNIFPNPASAFLTVNTGSTQSASRFLLIDITGRQLAIPNYTRSADHEYIVPVQDVPDGLYTLAIMDETTVLHRQLIFIKH
jgi:hypothetical protein